MPRRRRNEPKHGDMPCNFISTNPSGAWRSDKTISRSEGLEKRTMASPRGGAVQRTALVLVVIAAIAAAGAAYSYFSYTNPGSQPSTISSSLSTSQSTCAASPGQTANSSYTVTVTANEPGCGCTLVDSNSHGTLCVSTDADVGDNVFLAASLNDSDTVAFTITNSTGSVVFQTIACVGGGEFATPPSTGVGCGTDWDTAAPDPQGNPIAPGTYTLAATDSQGSPIILEANFTLG